MRSVLVTGGSGSFGKAFVRRLLQGGLSDRICVYSRGEHRQAEMREEFGDDGRLRFFIRDCRDLERLRRAMTGVDVVVHAAALKRVEACEYNPIEVTKTNVGGAINVIEASQDASVKKVVALSTDKAFDPVNAYGASKLLAEKMFLAANNTVSASGPRYSICRYGNVFASAGGVVPTWLRMIASGARTVPVSNPDVTRFYMTLDEAVDLVLRTLDTMPSEPAIPELPAYRLGDLAEAMGVLMDVRGLPPWEKVHEAMGQGNSSDKARRMSVAELREKLAEIGFRPKLQEAA
jgi:UDP-N-acetylglucosamine 4,6-dehydratase